LNSLKAISKAFLDAGSGDHWVGFGLSLYDGGVMGDDAVVISTVKGGHEMYWNVAEPEKNTLPSGVSRCWCRPLIMTNLLPFLLLFFSI
jgi:hypothetical protein